MKRALILTVLCIGGVLAVLAVIGLVHDPEPAPLLLPRAVVEIGGGKVSYHQAGKGADVVLLHGGMGSAEDFMPVLDALAARYRVTVVDRPGFGRSTARGDQPTYPGNARQAIALIRRLGLIRPIIVGHSHGGGVALEIAAQEPELSAGLVLLAPAWKPGEPASLLDRLGALPLVGEGLSATVGRAMAPAMIAAIVDEMLGPDRERVPADFVPYRQALWSNPRSLTAYSRQQATDHAGLSAISERLPSVRARAIVLGCDGDPHEGRTLDSRALARRLPNAELWWLSGCGHYVQYGQPLKVIEAVSRLSEASY